MIDDSYMKRSLPSIILVVHVVLIFRVVVLVCPVRPGSISATFPTQLKCDQKLPRRQERRAQDYKVLVDNDFVSSVQNNTKGI